MSVGAFSISLSVKNLEAARKFYAALGFELVQDGSDNGYVILKNGDAVIGLFQGMFEGNILTFNPGWAQDGSALETPFEDIRDLQHRFVNAGIEIANPVAPDGTGPASFTITDPDGNTVLFDQHVAKP